MISILFVDDEPLLLQAIRRMMYSMRGEWETFFACSGSQALDLLASRKCDVIVTDMRMPEMNGVQLLARIRELYPAMTRIVLSGQSDNDLIIQAAGLAHQYLAKPCDPKMLRLCVQRSGESQALLHAEALKQKLAHLQSIPSRPGVYTRLVEALATPNTTVSQVAQIIATDLALSAKILQLVNSAFFGLPRHVVNIAQAVSLLGTDTIKALSLAIPIFTRMDQPAAGSFDPDLLWAHSLRVAAAAREIMLRVTGDRLAAEEAFVSGLLHDVGHLLLAINMPAEHARARQRIAAGEPPTPAMERECFGATHAEAGGFLLGTWGLPEPVVAAVLFHHEPWDKGGMPACSLHAVCVANLFDLVWHALPKSDQAAPSEAGAKVLAQLLSDPALEWKRIGCEHLLPVWIDTCMACELRVEKGEPCDA